MYICKTHAVRCLKKILEVATNGGKTEETAGGSIHLPLYTLSFSFFLDINGISHWISRPSWCIRHYGHRSREETVLKNHKKQKNNKTNKTNWTSGVSALDRVQTWKASFSLAFCVQATIHCKDQARRTPRVFAFVCASWFFPMTFCKSNILSVKYKKPQIDRGPRGGELEE